MLSSSSSSRLTRLEMDEQTGSGLRLANQVFSTCFETNKNAVLSPLSIHVALSMVAAGAAGHVKEEIISFLGAKSEEQLHKYASIATDVIFSDHASGPTLSAANMVCLSDAFIFKSAFKQAMKTDFKAVTKLLDFTKVDESVREVNEWAEKVSNGLIKDIVNSNFFKTEPRTKPVLFLANALYFNGAWLSKFFPEQTKCDDFHLMDGSSSVSVPFMCKDGSSAKIGTYDTFKVLNLPYFTTGRDKHTFSMSIFLPNDRNGLPSLLQRVCGDGSDFLDRHIPKKLVSVGKLRIPKFKIEVNFNVMQVLEELGLKIGVLTEVVVVMPKPPVMVSKIAQKAFVEVNEEGTKAAAFTLSMLRGGGDTPPISVDFIADHPFLFVIQENSTGLVLFVGRVLDPST